MSGFEIAGLVLGAIPIILESIKIYNSGLSKFQAIRKYDRIFDDIESGLRGAVAILRQTCETLLLGVGVPDDELRDLLEKQKGWGSEVLKRKLRARLGERDYDDFEIVAKSLRRRLGELGTQLELTEQWKTPFMIDGKVDKDKRREFFRVSWSRIKRGFKADEHTQLIAQIRDDAVSLHLIVQSALTLMESRASRGKGQGSSWKKSREQALRLHEVLESSWGTSCDSHSHSIWMRFSPPTKRNIGYEAKDRLNCSFALTHAEISKGSLPWEWRDIQILANDFRPPPALGTTQNVSTSVPTFAIHNVDDLHPQCNCSKSIQNFCQALYAQPTGNACRGFLQGPPWNYHLHDDIRYYNHARENKSLRRKMTEDRRGHILTAREKRLISLLLASVVLQLHGTRWLSQSWTLDDVFMLGNNELCVRYTFEPASHMDLGSHDAHGAGILRNETLFSLGEALLELTYQETLSSADTRTRYCKAVELAKRLQNDELEEFATTVAKCLNPSSPTFLDFDLTQESFFDWYYQEVVIPLKEDYEVFLR